MTVNWKSYISRDQVRKRQRFVLLAWKRFVNQLELEMLKITRWGKPLICWNCSHDVQYIYLRDGHQYCQECYSPTSVIHPEITENLGMGKYCPKCNDKTLYQCDNGNWFCVECCWESLPSYIPHDEPLPVTGTKTTYKTNYSWARDTFPINLTDRLKLKGKNITLDGHVAYIIGDMSGMVATIWSFNDGRDCLFTWPVVHHTITKRGGAFLSRHAL